MSSSKPSPQQAPTVQAPQGLEAPDENKLMAERREKLSALRQQCAAGGTVPFPNDFKPRHQAGDLQTRYAGVANEQLEPQAVSVSVAGRLMLKRVMGKACFGTLQDGSFGPKDMPAGRIQVYVTLDAVGEDTLNAF